MHNLFCFVFSLDDIFLCINDVKLACVLCLFKLNISIPDDEAGIGPELEDWSGFKEPHGSATGVTSKDPVGDKLLVLGPRTECGKVPISFGTIMTGVDSSILGFILLPGKLLVKISISNKKST
jgi:hypothetical protein